MDMFVFMIATKRTYRVEKTVTSSQSTEQNRIPGRGLYDYGVAA